MPKSLILKPHLSSEELKQRYRNSCDRVERSHYQIIWLLASGKTVSEVSKITSYSTKWVDHLAGRYNQLGEEGYELRLKQPRPAHTNSDPWDPERWKKADATPRAVNAQGNAHQANSKTNINNYVGTILTPE